ncbi:MAG: IS66 family transposase [Halofilum sp. (in: g-proteobacteria)]|nr:IS66 family transposase [Halofilum sp. (in: g-proteobacteria)]
MRVHEAHEQKRLAWYQEQQRLARAKRFAASADTPPGQHALLDEAEREVHRERTHHPVKGHKRRNKGGGGRVPLPDHLPREVVVHELEAAECTCGCGGALHVVDTEITEQLEQVPAKLYVVEHHRRRYACRCCGEGMQRAPAPAAPIRGARVGPQLLAALVAGKYVESMPLYRMAAYYQRHEVDLDRQTLARWMLGAAELVAPVLDRLHALLLTRSVIHVDETPVQVLKEAGRSAKQKSTMWVYASGGLDPPIRLYAYQQSRGSEHPRRLLDGFAGYLQSDGFAGYDALARAQPAITGVGCWAHARRKFVDVQKAQAGVEPEGEAARFIKLIRALYQLEQRLAGETASERRRQRQRRAGPILERIRDRLERTAPRVPPKSLLGKAITYARKQWPQLVRYIEHGETAIDNNTAERAIKPFVIGRKNWLFANTPGGARASANLYGLIETAKANAIDPYGYLAHLFTELPQRDLDAGDPVDDLLPWNVELPDPAAN